MEHARQLNTGASGGLATAYAEHSEFLRSRLRALGVATADLDDATQDVFEVLVRRIADYDPSLPLRNWLAGIARRVARRYRERGARTVVPFADVKPSEAPSPELAAAQAEARETLARFLKTLDRERWEVFVLSEIEGLRGSEIAELLDLNANTTYARIRSARKEFSRTLRRLELRRRREARAWYLAWLPQPLRGGASTPTLVVVGVAALCLGAAGGRFACSPDDSAPGADVGAGTLGQAPSEPSLPARAPRPTARRVDPAGVAGVASERPARSAPDGWVVASSGVASLEGENGWSLSRECRYRLSGDRVELVVTYIGDDDRDTQASEGLELEGFEVWDGSPEWRVAIPAGEAREIRTVLQARRQGRVELTVMARPHEVDDDRELGEYDRLELVFEDGALRYCRKDGECEDAPAEREALSGESVTINVINDCDEAKELALYAAPEGQRPPADAPRTVLEPGERRQLTIDVAQALYTLRPNGRVRDSAHVDRSGATVRYYGRGCGGVTVNDPAPIPADDVPG